MRRTQPYFSYGDAEFHGGRKTNPNTALEYNMLLHFRSLRFGGLSYRFKEHFYRLFASFVLMFCNRCTKGLS